MAFCGIFPQFGYQKFKACNKKFYCLGREVLASEGAISKVELVDKMGYSKLTDSVLNAITELIAKKKDKIYGR